MILKHDCIHFPGDRPCKPHKETGITCPECNLYQPVVFKILILKLDAMGDVLRTTSILHKLKEKYQGSDIIWLTKKNAKELFFNNELVNKVLVYEDNFTYYSLLSEKYDMVINLDPSPESSAIASAAISDNKIGFGLNEKGKVYPYNKEAEEWFEMGAFDFLKKRNTKTYQQVIHEICSLDYDKGEIILRLSAKEKAFKEAFIEKHNLKKYDFIIGINPGASSRWQYKRWRPEGFKELIEKLDKLNCAVLLYGGEDERELNTELLNVRSKNLINTGSDNSLREFIALVDISDIFITGDTLALHIATALKKEVICMFGPTSHAEIESYGRITKIYPDLECLVCYKNTCDFVPHCMDLITSDMIFNEVLKKTEKLVKVI